MELVILTLALLNYFGHVYSFVVNSRSYHHVRVFPVLHPCALNQTGKTTKYTKDQLLNVNNPSLSVPSNVLTSLAQLGVRNSCVCQSKVVKSDKRGTRGGTRKQRKIMVCQGIPRDTVSKNRTTTTVNKKNLIQIDTRNVFQHNCPNLRIGCINTQSCCNKTNIVRDVIEEMNIDLLCITETWLRTEGDESIIADLLPPGFELKSFSRGSRGGGIAFIHRRGLPVKFICGGPSYRTFQSATAFIRSEQLTFRVTCIYRPPPNKKNKFTSKEFFIEFQDLLFQLEQAASPFYIIGDFNFHFDVPSVPDTKRLVSILDDHNLQQLIKEPTHRSGHILDLLITNTADQHVLKHQVLDKAISDHSLLIANINISKPKHVRRSILSRNTRTIDTQALRDDVSKTLTSLSSLDADTFHDTLKAAIDQHAPMVKRNISSRPFSP
ncbi:uncharacterized protein LOC118478439 [Aplysia californica]|uniref:Uncharacterized protein LOC118478439 n=1 Tax=Aplysia californica TaxID=6500 RepID=A0ABM1VZU7_APLCA|nr:uncharacterized protein LOC118478439 [Aplysia californica]